MKLLDEGKTFKYLKYAIGEIALIIIGIMIALQLNNMNEDRKAQVEFDVYISQLKGDVRTAIEDANNSKTFMEKNVESGEFVMSFLKLPQYDAEQLASFEKGITDLGSYNEPQVYVGLLGDLMNGNMDVLSRDRSLAQKALEMESGVERWLGNLDHIYNQIDLANNELNLLRGKGNNNLGVPPIYDLDKLKNSDEFVYGAYSITSRGRTMVRFCGLLAVELDAFLAVLEEYE